MTLIKQRLFIFCSGQFWLLFLIAALIYLLMSHVGQAQVISQTAPASPAVATVAIAFWLQLVIAVAGLSIPGALVIFGTWLKAHFKLAAGSNAANIIDLLVAGGQQFAAAALAKAPASADPVDVKNKAVAEFLNTLSDSTEAAIKLKGTSAATIAQRIDGALAMALTPTASPVTTKGT